jgi:hypothetical protein
VEVFNAVVTTSTPGFAADNPTAATVGVPVQYSPGFIFGGTGWDTDDVVSRYEEWMIEMRPSSSTTVRSELHFLRRQDGGAWVSEANISSVGGLTALTQITLGAQTYVRTNVDLSSGLGSTAGIDTTLDAPLVMAGRTRTDGVDNIVCATAYDRNAASITNAETMRLHSFGWTDNTNTYNELAAIHCDGTYKSEFARDLQTTDAYGIYLANTTAATVGVTKQYSPGVLLSGTAWDTNGAVSKTLDWMIESRTVDGNEPYQSLLFLGRTDGGAWATGVEFRGSINGPGYTSIIATYTRGSTYIQGGNIFLQSYDSSTGLGAVDNVRTATDNELILLHTNRTDGVSNVVFASVYDRNAASITNADTMRLHSFGWTNDSNAYTELAAVYCDGHMHLDGYISLTETSDPTTVIDTGLLYTKESDSITELFYQDDAGTVTQLTIDGYVGGTETVIADGYDELAPSDTDGTETILDLSESPIIEPSMPSGRALDMFINGQKMRYVDAYGADPTEWTYDAGANRVTFPASGEANTWYCARYRTTTGINPPPALLTTVFSSVVLDQDRTSTVVDKSGKNTVAIDITLTEGGGGPFNADGTLRVLAGNSAGLTEADALDVPQWAVTTDGIVKLELVTGFTHVGLFYDFSADGDDDTISATIAVS